MGKTKRAKATTKPDGDKVTLDDGNAGIGNKYRDRVKELRRVRASELNANPKNWRTHSEGQSLAMKGILSEVGWADAVLARETSGGLELIDGHLRKEIAPDELVPVLVLDVDESEADKILLTHDPLAELAEANTFQLEQLLESVEIDNKELDAMLAEMSEAVGVFEVFEDSAPDLPSGERGEIVQIIVTLHKDQSALLDQAIDKAVEAGEFVDTQNNNKNGNAIARIAEAYLA